LREMEKRVLVQKDPGFDNAGVVQSHRRHLQTHWGDRPIFATVSD